MRLGGFVFVVKCEKRDSHKHPTLRVLWKILSTAVEGLG